MKITTEQFIEFNTNSVEEKLNRTFHAGEMLKSGALRVGMEYEVHFIMTHVNYLGKPSQRVLIVLDDMLAIFDMTLSDFQALKKQPKAA